MTITKAVDPSSPLLLKALLRNSVKDADIIILKPTERGGNEQVLMYSLEEGRIAGHRINVTPGDGELETETVSLVFDSLTMTFGSVEAEYQSTQ